MKLMIQKMIHNQRQMIELMNSMIEEQRKQKEKELLNEIGYNIVVAETR